MVGELAPLVPGECGKHRRADGLRHVGDQLDEQVDDRPRVAGRQRAHPRVAGLALHERDEAAAQVAPDDEAALPMARDGAVGGLGRALRDLAALGPAAPGAGGQLRAGPPGRAAAPERLLAGELLAQRPPPLHRSLVYGLMADPHSPIVGEVGLEAAGNLPGRPARVEPAGDVAPELDPLGELARLGPRRGRLGAPPGPPGAVDAADRAARDLARHARVGEADAVGYGAQAPAGPYPLLDRYPLPGPHARPRRALRPLRGDDVGHGGPALPRSAPFERDAGVRAPDPGGDVRDANLAGGGLGGDAAPDEVEDPVPDFPAVRH